MRLHELLVSEATAAGFPLAGAVDLDQALHADGCFLEHIGRYDSWLSQGMHGAMEYLNRGRDRRADPRVVFPGAEAVFSVAIPYRRGDAAADDAESARYARYIDGPDYHDVIAEKLEAVMNRVKDLSHDGELDWKVCVDTSAVLERTWAMLAGLGWIGKNTLLIHPKLGSYLFIGEVLINRKTGQGPRPMPELCGACKACLTACPTQALRARTLDSRKCISYWTLENRGEIALPEETKARFGPNLAGCDICQEACPFNIKPSREADPLHEISASQLSAWEALLDETPEAYRARVKNSALSRVKPAQFSRNLALAVRNSLAKIPPSLDAKISARAESETDAIAKAEWALTTRKAESRRSPPGSSAPKGI